MQFQFRLPLRPQKLFNSIREFSLGVELGDGGFSIVYEARLLRTNQLFAIKVIDFRKLGNLDQENVQKEIEAHIQLGHENVVKLFDFFEEGQKVYLVLELCAKGNLYDYLKKKQGFLSLSEI